MALELPSAGQGISVAPAVYAQLMLYAVQNRISCCSNSLIVVILAHHLLVRGMHERNA